MMTLTRPSAESIKQFAYNTKKSSRGVLTVPTGRSIGVYWDQPHLLRSEQHRPYFFQNRDCAPARAGRYCGRSPIGVRPLVAKVLRFRFADALPIGDRQPGAVRNPFQTPPDEGHRFAQPLLRTYAGLRSGASSPGKAKGRTRDTRGFSVKRPGCASLTRAALTASAPFSRASPPYAHTDPPPRRQTRRPPPWSARAHPHRPGGWRTSRHRRCRRSRSLPGR